VSFSCAVELPTVTTAPQTAADSVDAPRRALSWRAAFVLSLGGALLVTVSLGAMAAEIGAASLLVWGGTVLVGTLQCLLLTELAGRFPGKVGGAPAYTHEGFRHRTPFVGAAATWGYWVAWIPGVAVNLTLAATYLRAAFLPQINTLALTALLAAGLYALNSLGLRPSVWLSGLLAACAIPPLAIILAAPLFRPGSWHPSHFTPLVPAGVTAAALAKWAFVAAWSSYGAEMVTTVAGELRDPRRDLPKAVGAASVATLLAFVLVPVGLLGIVGVEGLAQDPYVAFLTAAERVFGAGGGRVVAVMLIAALILGAQVFIVSSSRALYQMSRDGLTLQGYGRLNRRGVPVGSVGWDAAITLALLLIFRGDIVGVVAAANVGYLVVFALLPVAYVLVRRRAVGLSSFALPGVFVPLAWGLAAFNAVLLVYGGAQWGAKVVGTGVALVLTCLPLYWWRQAGRGAMMGGAGRWHRD
jgi:amino acid transporter